MKKIMLSTSKINKYKIGDFVKIKILKGDKSKADRTYLPYKIINSIRNDKYQLRYQFGILNITYLIRHLESLDIYISELEKIPRKQISLREAARLQSTLQIESQAKLQI